MRQKGASSKINYAQIIILRDGPRENRLLREHGGQPNLNLICYKVGP